jgi:hypothetical protein
MIKVYAALVREELIEKSILLRIFARQGIGVASNAQYWGRHYQD